MLYWVIQEEDIFPAKQRLKDSAIPIHPCQKMHLFVYVPGKSTPLVREYLCKCEPCYNLDFKNCIHQYDSAEIDDVEKPSLCQVMLLFSVRILLCLK